MCAPIAGIIRYFAISARKRAIFIRMIRIIRKKLRRKWTRKLRRLLSMTKIRIKIIMILMVPKKIMI
jgi:lipopolysaccharide biosynthesis glycosyltransferase